MYRLGQPAAAAPGATPTSRWRRRALNTGWVAVIATVVLTGLLTGLIGVIKVQAVIIPLNIELREGCLADPSLVDPQARCPKEGEATLRYHDGHTVVIRGTPQEVQRRIDRAVDEVVVAERWRGVGYLLVAALLIGSGIAAIVFDLVRRRPWRTRLIGQPRGEATS
jgi:hypothetical protein